MRLIEYAQFDTVYHEHFSYLSLYTVRRIFASVGLRIWNVEELPTHGGSLRLYGCHEDDVRETHQTVNTLLDQEIAKGLQQLDTYLEFQPRANKIKNDLLGFLVEQKRDGKKVVAYGAAAKGNTLLNYAGIKPDLISFVCDAAPSKQGRFMPGSHIPILPPEQLHQASPDYILILPWNLASEVRLQKAPLERNGTRFVISVPALMIL
jgi:hypothetical protein